MEGKQKAKEIIRIVLKFIWIAFAGAMWGGGLAMFLNVLDDPNTIIIMYFVWGALCAVCNISDFFANAFAQGKQGARSGANNYTVSGDGYGNVTVQNHPFRDAIIGFVIGIIVGLLLGPIIIPIKIIRALIDGIKMIVSLKKAA